MQPTTYDQFEAMVRQTLNSPDAESPSRLQIWHAANAAAQFMFIEAGNTHITWSGRDERITAAAGQQDIALVNGDFGKAICINTADPSNPYHVPQEIKIAGLGEVGSHYSGARQAASGGHSAACFSVLWQNGTPYLRVTPIPSETVFYTLTYETDSGTFEGATSSFQFPQFIHLLRYKVALELLPYCQWSSLAKDEALVRGQGLTQMLLMKQNEYQKQWDYYLTTDTDSGSFVRDSYGGDW